MEEDVKVKSLQKALKVIECFTPANPSLGVSEIARMLGLNKSNVHNILSTLEDCGYINKNKVTEKYELGYKLLQFSYTIMASYQYTNFVVPVMKDLSQDLNLIIYFGVAHADHVLYFFSSYPKGYGKSVPYRSILGETAPYYCTSIGKALLYSMSEEMRELCLKGEKVKFTEFTLTDNDRIKQDLALSKERGYAIDNCEHEDGVRCVGVPVTDRNGNLIGAISASGPVSLVTDENLKTISQKLLTAAFEIRSRL